MKLVSLLTTASVGTALVIPDQWVLTPANARSPSDAGFSISALRDSPFFKNIEWAIGKQSDRVELAQTVVEHDLDISTDDSGSYQVESLFGSHKPHHTIYEKIKKNKHSKIFAKLVDEFDDIVKKLNSSSSTHTVFVPSDKAFKKFHRHPRPPKEFLKAFVEYHISPECLSAKKIFSMRTIPTCLEDHKELGHYPQRISTQFGLRGLTLNFLSHIVKSNIKAKNGIIHALDHFLIPPFMATDTVGFIPSVFSTFDLGILKTGLFELLNKTSTHTGGTFFVPTNSAFKKLGPCANAFLFSRWGEKHLEALLKYHIVFNHTLYSDAYNKPEEDEVFADGTTHIDLPTLLKDHHVSVDIAHYNRFYSIKINGFTTVAAADVAAKDGVIHVLHDVLIPPRKPHLKPRGGGLNDMERSHLRYSCFGGDGAAWRTAEDLMARLDPLLEEEIYQI